MNADANLHRYLNDHLAGSAGAVDLIQTLADVSELIEDKTFFTELKGKVEADRAMLKDLIGKLGRTHSSVLEAAGNLTGKASRLKLMWEGLEPGELGIFEAIEMLCLGIQGKRLLWVVLAEIQPLISEWGEYDFKVLELEAIEQRDAVENRRVEAGVNSLIDSGRRAQETQVHGENQKNA